MSGCPRFTVAKIENKGIVKGSQAGFGEKGIAFFIVLGVSRSLFMGTES